MSYKFLQKSLLFATLLGSTVPLTAQQSNTADNDAWALWNSGYESYEKSKKARVQGKYDEALLLLERAKSYYIQAKNSRPDWNQKVIDSRIELVDTDIAALQKLKSGEPVETVAPTVTAAKTPSLPRLNSRQVREMQLELEQYRNKTLELTAEVEKLKSAGRTAAANTDEMENLVRENQELSDRNTALLRKIQDFELQLKQPDIEKNDLRNRLVEEKINFETAVKRVELIQKENEQIRQETAGAYQERNQLRIAERDLNTKLRALERELTSLRTAKTLDDNERNAFKTQLTGKEEELRRLTARIAEQEKLYNELFAKYDSAVKNTAGLPAESAAALSDNVKLSEDLLAAAKNNDALQTKVNTQDEARRQDAVAIKELRETLQNCQINLTNLGNELDLARKQMEQDLGKITELTADKTKLQERNSKLKNDVITLTGNVEQLKKRLETGSNNVQTLIDLNTQNRELYAKLAAQESEMESLRSHADIYAKKLAETAAELKNQQAAATQAAANLELEAEAAALKQHNTELENSLNVLQANVEKMTAELRIAAEKAAAVPELQQQLAASQAANQVLESAQAKSQKLEADIQKLTQEAAALTKAKNEVEQELTKANSLLEKFRKNENNADSETLKSELAKLNADRLAQQNALAALQREAEQQNAKIQAAKTAAEIEVLLKAAETDNDVKAQIAAHFAGAAEAQTRQATEVAMFHYRKVLELKPNDFTATRNLGILEYSRGNTPKAAELLLAALTENPADAEAAGCYAELLLADNKPGNAEAVLTPALTQNQENYQLRLLHGRSLASLGKVAEAENELLKLNMLDDSNPAANLALAELLARNCADRLPEAAELYIAARDKGALINPYLEETLKPYLQNDAETVEFIRSSALEAEKNQDWEAAMWFYREWSDLEPGRALPVYNLAWSLLMQNKNAEAAELLADSNTVTGLTLRLLSLPAAAANALELPEIAAENDADDALQGKIDTLLSNMPDTPENNAIRQKIAKIRESAGKITQK